MKSFTQGHPVLMVIRGKLQTSSDSRVSAGDPRAVLFPGGASGSKLVP